MCPASSVRPHSMTVTAYRQHCAASSALIVTMKTRYMLRGQEKKSHSNTREKKNWMYFPQEMLVSLSFPYPSPRHYWMFSTTSACPNTISHSVTSLPDGPWPSQPYLHRLTGPTSFHRGGLLAGKTHLHSLFIFQFCTVVFQMEQKQCGRALTTAELHYVWPSGFVWFVSWCVCVCLWCLLLGYRPGLDLYILCVWGSAELHLN